MASSGTGCDPVVIESDENNSSQNELDSENNFKCCQGKKTYKAEDVLRLKKEKNVCWLFFHIGENAAGNGPDKTKVHCNLCARVINYHQSPTNLVSHMKGYHNKIGLLLTKRRLCMTGENVNKQLFLKDKLNKQI